MHNYLSSVTTACRGTTSFRKRHCRHPLDLFGSWAASNASCSKKIKPSSHTLPTYHFGTQSPGCAALQVDRPCFHASATSAPVKQQKHSGTAYLRACHTLQLSTIFRCFRSCKKSHFKRDANLLDLHMRLIKGYRMELATPLTSIINASLQQSKYP